jgi:aryl-alcohol dehydrogenase-like predicted oxidoreductase
MHFGEMLDEDRYLGAIQHAYEKGIRTFMTADAYGMGEADTMLGKALNGMPRDSYCLIGAIGHDFYNGEREGSKGFPRFTDARLRDASGFESYAKMAVERSLERCGLDKFDLLMLHNPDVKGYSDATVWDALAKVKASGLTERLGLAPGPANGYTLDVLNSFEKFGELIDWAMIILNPLEPWPGQLVLSGAAKYDIDLITRVVDYGGLFHDDVRPGHPFPERDHRKFRPAGWVENGGAKMDEMRPIAKKYGVTMLQLSCLWNLSQSPVKSVIPTMIQEPGEKSKTIHQKIEELASMPVDVVFTKDEILQLAAIGNNKGCMMLKGANAANESEITADRWPLTPELKSVADRWGINAHADLAYLH